MRLADSIRPMLRAAFAANDQTLPATFTNLLSRLPENKAAEGVSDVESKS